MSLLVQAAEAPEDEYRHIHQAADEGLRDTQLGVQRWLRTLFESLSVADLADLLAERNPAALLDAFPWETFRAGLGSSLVTNLTDIYGKAGDLAAIHPPEQGVWKLEFTRTNPEAVNWINQHTAERVTQVTTETQMAIRKIVNDSFTQPYTTDESARRIKNVVGLTRRQAEAVNRYAKGLREIGHTQKTVDRLSTTYHDRLLKFRAENIARTESIDAAVAGQQQLWEQAIQGGFIDRANWVQEWVVTLDDRTCPRCRPMQGQRARLGGVFQGGYSGPTLHPRCRCAVILRRVDSIPYGQPIPEYDPERRTLQPRAPALTR